MFDLGFFGWVFFRFGFLQIGSALYGIRIVWAVFVRLTASCNPLWWVARAKIVCVQPRPDEDVRAKFFFLGEGGGHDPYMQHLYGWVRV